MDASGINWRQAVLIGGKWGQLEASGVDQMQVGLIGGKWVDWW